MRIDQKLKVANSGSAISVATQSPPLERNATALAAAVTTTVIRSSWRSGMPMAAVCHRGSREAPRCSLKLVPIQCSRRQGGRRPNSRERALTIATALARRALLHVVAPSSLAVVALLLVALQPQPSHADDGQLLYDLGPRWQQVGDGEIHDVPIELAIAFFTDCAEAAGLSPPSCGSSPAQWVAPFVPVAFCTLQSNRPSSISASEFRDAVTAGAAAWNDALAAVGVDYSGDCPGGGTWQKGNIRNEIGFDDSRNVVAGQSVAITLGTWQSFFQPGSSQTVVAREFVESDIVMDNNLNLPDACFVSTMTHELGHALGFGHSDSASDLMFPSFNPSIPSTCPVGPTSAEVVLLRALYGSDGAPTVDAGLDRTVDLSANVTLAASGSDPEGGPVSYQWQQTAGQTVALSSGGAARSVTFTAPASVGTLAFEVTALDQFLHATSDSVTIAVSGEGGVPASTPIFHSFLPAAFVPGSPAGTTSLGWEAVDGASSYEICTAVSPIVIDTGCSSGLAAPSRAVDWGNVLGAAGSADATRVLSSGWRVSRIQACSSQGCSEAVDGPIAGGVRWDVWDIDYDFLAMTFDIAGFQFTFAAAINLSGTARQFELGNGPPGDPFRTTIGKCTSIGQNGLCFAFLDFNAKDQQSIVGVRSTRPGTPTTEHHVVVR